MNVLITEEIDPINDYISLFMKKHKYGCSVLSNGLF